MSQTDFLQEQSQYNIMDPLLHEIKELFFSYFDHPWLINIIDELPESIGYMGPIRTFLTLSSILPLQENIVLTGLTGLKTMVRIINIWLIPETNDIFGISAFSQRRTLSNRKLRQCISYTLPANTNNLAMLVEELEKEIIKESLIMNLSK